MIVAELMTRNPLTVGPKDTLQLAYEKMEAGRFRQVPVLDQETLVGILTDRDTRQHLGQMDHIRVDTVMTVHPYAVGPSAPIEEAAELLITNKIGSLPVVEDNKLVGIITATDMLKALQAVLGVTSDGSSRIDLDLKGSGEIAAATGLIRTVCPLLGIGTYHRTNIDGEVLYVRIASTNAQQVASALKDYGFKVIAVHS